MGWPGPQAQLKIDPDRRLCARYNVRIEDVVQVINVAMGSEPLGILYEGERRFDIAAKLGFRRRFKFRLHRPEQCAR
ncbi:MAG: hypothetical protein FWD31_04145 [Planctomycetaceae bacterium]|nr:hypothetical protein [Planctomycetaceae bacterium]